MEAELGVFVDGLVCSSSAAWAGSLKLEIEVADRD